MMENNMHDRMSDTPRRRGRPPKEQRPPATTVEAMPVVLPIRHVPPLNCPKCGRGMVPRVQRWDGAVANCLCSLCAGRFDYTPPQVRSV